MERPKKYWCFSCNKPCQIIKAIEDGEEVYQCSFCKNAFVEEMEEKNEQQNHSNATNSINNLNSINTINNNIPQTSVNISISSNESPNNSSNSNREPYEYGLDGTLLFLPSTVHYKVLNSNNMIPNIINSVSGIFSNIGPTINNLFFSSSNNSNNSNNNILSFLNNHNNDFQFNNFVNIIMSLDPNLLGNPPASQRAIDSLPKFEVNKDNIDKFKDITCNICLEGFEIGNVLRVLECKHEFHETCIITWLKSRNTCPVCRHELESNDPNYERRKRNHRENLRNYHRNSSNNLNNNNNNNNNNGGNSGIFV